jgi:hypothetical protein
MQTRQAGLEGTGEILLRDLVKESLRMRPSRILGRQIEDCQTSLGHEAEGLHRLAGGGSWASYPDGHTKFSPWQASSEGTDCETSQLK